MADPVAPMYRYRGSVEPSAKVSRPVAAVRNAATDSGSTSATVDIFDVIDSYGGWWGISAEEVDKALQQLGDVDKLYVRVNSPGGQATEGVAIANILRAHPAEVHVTVIGLAASAASVITVAGDVVTMAPGSMLMIHEASGGVWGPADFMRQQADALDKISESYAGLYALKGGGDADTYRALMRAETWMTADDAVEAGLADQVGLDPSPAAPVIPDSDDEDDVPDIEVDVTVEITPAASAARRFDLSAFQHVPDVIAAAAAHTLPAEPPEKPPTTEEADTMSDTLIKALRERLSLGDDADEAAVLAKADELLEQATAPTGDAPAATAEPTDEQVAAYLAKTGKTAVSTVKLDELEEGVKDGIAARAKQRTEERDAAIAEAFAAGKISADRRDAWKASWDKDPEGVAADLESLDVRFPVAKQLPGVPGGDNADSAVFSDDEAAALATLTGTTKEALLHG